MQRRTYLKLAGIGSATVGGSLLMTRTERSSEEPIKEGGPPDSDWTLAFQDRFEDEELNRENWGIGWGWGWDTDTSPTRASGENVRVRDNMLHLQGTHDGDDIVSGVVNTKNTVSFSSGSYLEARIRFAPRRGFLNAFWAKPISEVWPPEIDVVELFQRGNPGDRRRSHHTLHYSASTRPGDTETHRNVDETAIPGGDLTENFHIYGFEWRKDRLAHYVDGELVRVWRDDVLLNALSIDVPYYLMLSLNIDNVGTADKSEQWGEEMAVDWVRLWRTDNSETGIGSATEQHQTVR